MQSCRAPTLCSPTVTINCMKPSSEITFGRLLLCTCSHARCFNLLTPFPLS